ncbi:MAG: TIGR02444 family protein [Azospirillaceae bacterium]
MTVATEPPDLAWLGIPDDPLWRFALDIYQRPGVAEACLSLQDDCGADVNLLLFALWCAAEGEELTPDTARAAGAAIAPWSAVAIQPLRRLRRALKPPVAGVPDDRREAVRNRTKSLELAAERIALARLHEFAREMSRPPASANRDRAMRDNLSAALALAAAGNDARSAPAVERLVAAVLRG